MVVRLRLVSVYLVIARWSNDVLVTLLLLSLFVPLFIIINRLAKFSQKEKAT
jgi:hypothetical protein